MLTYHAKSLEEIAKHFDDMAKDLIKRRDALRKLRPRAQEIKILTAEISAYFNARDIIKSTKLSESE